ncbi:MAG: rod shape-determining protein [Candidatus Dadabacteria bacterium]|nr:MAG: rod shape-determining protein [Candidatus Dadabacteria bacterium]
MFRVLARDLAVDLGTANTLIYEKGTGVVLDEPSIVALKQDGPRRDIVAIGAEAKEMLGRTPEGVKVIRPIRTGVIADFEVAGLMLREFIGRARKKARALFKPRVIVGVPSGITEVEKRAIRDSIEGEAREVKLIDEAMAAAIGCGLPVTEATASLIVDIGGGTTDIAVISLKDIVHSVSVRRGGDAMDEAIINHMRRRHHLLIGEATAELIKKTIGSAHSDYDNQEMEVRGRSLTSGSPAALVVTGEEIREATAEVVNTICASIRQALENTPPELSGDIIESGIMLAGGGALLKGLDRRVHEELGIEVKVAEDPLCAVVEGAGKVLDNTELYKDVWFQA